MFSISIHDLSNGALAFDLADIVNLDRTKVLRSKWKCSGVEALGSQADELEKLPASGACLSGDAFFGLAHGVDQIIDGDFVGVLPEASTPWLVIRAVDSSSFVVLTHDKNFYNAVSMRFSDVRDSPGDQSWFDCTQG